MTTPKDTHSRMKHLRARIALCLTLALSAAGPIFAQDGQGGPVVVELFTSQGCSSCPPADALMRELAGREDVIGLALHVDYWDYIGWKDEFAIAGHTDRQKAYAQNAGRRMIYTPQMIVMGQDSLVGAKAMKLADLLAKHRARPRQVNLHLTRDGGNLLVSLEALAALKTGEFDVHLLRYVPSKSVRITRGENARRTLDYANIVESWEHLGTWDGRARAVIEAKISGDLPAIILVQHAQTGPIVAAARAQ